MFLRIVRARSAEQSGIKGGFTVFLSTFCRIVLLNTVKCLIIMHCGVLFYPVLYSRGVKKLLYFKKSLISFKKGVKKGAKKSK